MEASTALLLAGRVKCLERCEKKMNSKRNRISTFAIALLMLSLVIMFVPTCYAQELPPDDLPWNNETIILPWNNETDILPIPPLPPLPPVTDPLEELNLKIGYLNTNLQDLTREFFLLQTDYNADVEELNSKIESLENNADVEELNSKIESLENKISSLQTTILFAYIALAGTVIGGFYFIKRMR